MSEEIKKIKKCLISGYDIDIINREEMNYLWNYITNLQQENEDFKTIIKQYVDIVLYDRKIIEDYKSRCEKTIEILEQDKASASFNTAERIALNILNGSDEK